MQARQREMGPAGWSWREIASVSKEECRKLGRSSARVSQLNTEPEFLTNYGVTPIAFQEFSDGSLFIVLDGAFIFTSTH